MYHTKNLNYMSEVIKLDTVDQYNKLFHLETLHPLVSVVDLSEASQFPTHFTLNYGVYAIFLKNTKCGDIRYGRQIYDYQEGTVTSFAPGQVVKTEMAEGTQPSAHGLLFHPDLIKGTSLGLLIFLICLNRSITFIRRRKRNILRLPKKNKNGTLSSN